MSSFSSSVGPTSGIEPTGNPNVTHGSEQVCIGQRNEYLPIVHADVYDRLAKFDRTSYDWIPSYTLFDGQLVGWLDEVNVILRRSRSDLEPSAINRLWRRLVIQWQGGRCRTHNYNW